MRYLIFLLLLTASACPPEDYNEISNNFFQHWIHSHEDKQDVGRAYRPSDYKFPPSRGRAGFEFKKDGTFIGYQIAPTDGIDAKTGTWKRVKSNVLELTFKDTALGKKKIKILSVTKEMLVINELDY